MGVGPERPTFRADRPRDSPSQRGERPRVATGLFGSAAHADRGEEVFLAPAVRAEPRGEKQAVSETRFLWVDVDQPGQLHALWAFLAERPCHLLIESRRPGGVHAYWKLAEPLAATRVTSDRRAVEPIERANLRIVHRLGTGADGKPNVADPACAERSRVMRLAGTVNGKTGAYARIIEADLQLPAYPIGQLVGDLPDPVGQYRGGRHARDERDPYKRISPPRVLRAARRHRRAPRRARPLPGAGPRDATRRARSGPSRPGVAVPRRRAAGRGARSTTSRRCCSAARGAASCAAKRSSAHAPMSATCSASPPTQRQPARSNQDEKASDRPGAR